MWRPSFASIAVAAAFLHLALADTIQARDGKQFEKDAIIEPLGGTVDTQWPVVIRWKPETKGTISLKLLKGKAPDDMKEHETIADHIKNTGIFIWLTGDWLEDSSTMKEGYKYGLKIIDDVTGDYDYSPAFDLKVPHSTFQQQKTGGHKHPPKKGSKKVTPDDDKDDEDDADFEELEQVGTGKNHYHEHKKPEKTSTNSEDENPTVGVGKSHHGKPKPHGTKTNGNHKKPTTSDDDADFEEPENSPQKGTVKYDKNGKPIKSHPQIKGSQKKPSDADDEDFVELDSSPQKGQTKNQKNSGKPKPSVTNPDEDAEEDDDDEFDDEEEDFEDHDPPTGSTKPPSNAKGKSNGSAKNKSSSNSTKSGGLGKGAVIGIVVAVIVVIVLILLAIGLWKMTRHKRVMAEKQRSRIGYDGVGGFIADGRRSVVYDGPPMTQYNPRGSVEGRYDPPTGQGLPVVGSTPRQSLDTRYDPPSRQSVDTRYDPPSQAKPAHH